MNKLIEKVTNTDKMETQQKSSFSNFIIIIIFFCFDAKDDCSNIKIAMNI